MSDGLTDYFEQLQETETIFSKPEVDSWADVLDDVLGETTVELKCSCGSWAVYGRTCSDQLHQDYCDLKRKY